MGAKAADALLVTPGGASFLGCAPLALVWRSADGKDGETPADGIGDTAEGGVWDAVTGPAPLPWLMIATTIAAMPPMPAVMHAPMITPDLLIRATEIVARELGSSPIDFDAEAPAVCR